MNQLTRVINLTPKYKVLKFVEVSKEEYVKELAERLRFLAKEKIDIQSKTDKKLKKIDDKIKETEQKLKDLVNQGE